MTESLVHAPDLELIGALEQGMQNYPRANIFKDLLSGVPQQEVRNLISSVLTSRSPDFPNVNQLPSILARISQISWLNPNQKFDDADVSDQINRLYEILDLPKKHVTFTSDFGHALTIKEEASSEPIWRNRMDKIRDKSQKILEKSDRFREWDYARNLGLAASFKAMKTEAGPSIQRRVGAAAQYEVISDISSEPNPFEPLIAIYSMGLWPIGQTESEGFVIFRPEPSPQEKSI